MRLSNDCKPVVIVPVEMLNAALHVAHVGMVKTVVQLWMTSSWHFTYVNESLLLYFNLKSSIIVAYALTFCESFGEIVDDCCICINVL